MHPHPAEVVAEALLHVVAQHWLQQFARADKGLIYTGRRGIHMPGRLHGKALDAWWCAADRLMYRRRQHLMGDPVCFLFVDISGLANLEFGLQTQSLLFAAFAALATRGAVIATRAFALENTARCAHERGLCML